MVKACPLLSYPIKLQLLNFSLPPLHLLYATLSCTTINSDRQPFQPDIEALTVSFIYSMNWLSQSCRNFIAGCPICRKFVEHVSKLQRSPSHHLITLSYTSFDAIRSCPTPCSPFFIYTFGFPSIVTCFTLTLVLRLTLLRLSLIITFVDQPPLTTP